MRTKLKYSTDYTWATTLAFDQQYRLNSLFDPDFTGVGTQPTGFDQLSALYEKYRVWSCRYTIKFLERNTTGSKIVIVPSNSSSSFSSSQNAAMALPWAQFGLCNTYSNQLKFTQKVDLALLNGRTHQQYIDDDTTGAAINTNPSEVLNLHVILNSIDGGSNSNGCLLIVLEYDVEFYDPIMLSASFFNKNHEQTAEQEHYVDVPAPTTTPCGCVKK